jgi:alpha-1,2-mannosyltransferase
VLADVVALRRGWWWAGVGIGLATAVKLTPALFVLYLLLSRRLRPAAVAVGSFVLAGLLGLAVAPGGSLRYWGAVLWQTSRVGSSTDTENQSLYGLLARLAHPDPPSTPLWLLLAAVVLVGGLWRAVRAARAGDELTGVTLAGLTSCLLSPISWTHHLYWVVPAVVVLLDVAAGTPVVGRRRRWEAAVAGGVVYAVFAVSLVWAFGSTPHDRTVPGVAGVVGASADLLVLLALLVLLPVRRLTPAEPCAARTTAPPRPAGSSPR